MAIDWENDTIEGHCGYDGSRIHIRLAIDPDMDRDEFEMTLGSALEVLRNNALAEHRRLSTEVT